MDYYLDLLVEPIEISEIPYDDIVEASSDSYRKYPFDNKNFKLIDNTVLMANNTDTDGKLWNNNDELVNHFENILASYIDLPLHCPVDAIKKNNTLDDVINQYYHDIYNVADIVIAKSFLNKTRKLLIRCIQVCLNYNEAVPPIQFSVRLIYYFNRYFFKMSNHASYLRTSLNKLNELSKNPVITKYFTKKEIMAYKTFLTKSLENMEKT